MTFDDLRIRRIAMDAIGAARSDAARAERLRTRLEKLVGVVPEEHETADEIGRYGLEKFNQELPDNGDHASALEFYLAGHASARTGGGMDAAAPLPRGSFLDGYLRS
jgi:hypothetical protein